MASSGSPATSSSSLAARRVRPSPVMLESRDGPIDGLEHIGIVDASPRLAERGKMARVARVAQRDGGVAAEDVQVFDELYMMGRTTFS